MCHKVDRNNKVYIYNQREEEIYEDFDEEQVNMTEAYV